MSVFKWRKQGLSVLLAAAMTMGFDFAQAEATTETETHEAHHGNDWPGVYYGFLPCADCVGIKTTLALNKNNSYILITQYAGKSDREFVEKGKFTSGDKADILILTSRDGSNSRQYFAAKDMLIQLDDTGNRISGKLADRYILHRTDVTEKAQSHAH